MQKEFDVWNKQKKLINTRNTSNLYFSERQIWWCSVGCNIGSEIDGKHINFERPVLILKKVNKAQFIGIPLTSKSRNIYPSLICSKISGSLLFSQIRTLSIKRLLRKADKVSQTQFESVEIQFINYLKDRVPPKR